MSIHPLAGTRPAVNTLVSLPKLVTAYYALRPDPSEKGHRVAFGTSGHRGSSLAHSFNEDHILATTQAICTYRKAQGIAGPLFLAMDTHALSRPALASALEVLVANGVEVLMDAEDGYTPTPALSRAILAHNAPREGSAVSDGIVITPSHNPPEDGGFKYNPPSGGPADTGATKWIENEANRLLAGGMSGVLRVPFEEARAEAGRYDFTGEYVRALGEVLDLEAIRGASARLAVDPLGGAGVGYWPRIAEHFGLKIEVLGDGVDESFRFMTLDWDGKIRMDCSSPYAMAGLIALKDRYDVAWACDTDHDRHGIVTRSAGLMNPNHYLAVAIDYLFRNRPGWRSDAAIGKTLVSSSMIDRVAKALGRPMVEVPVGFKWFVDGLLDGSFGFGGEESAGASFLRRDGGPWSTDKDGLILGLLAAEILARTGRDPGEHYRQLTEQHGAPVYQRIDAPATKDQKAVLAKLSPAQFPAKELAGDPVEQVLTNAPGNGAAIGGLKVTTRNGWFAARPSGTEDVYKIYAESFLGVDHLRRLQDEAKALLSKVLSQ